jgi:NAD(P)-dependent dehydrogenase (short-subunit alcohol dehydrogenase family)
MGPKLTKGVALVTGGGSGIGQAVAHALLDDGWSVAVAGRRAGRLEDTLHGSSAGLAIVADVADPASVDALFEAVLDRFGRLDLLFNNAGAWGVAAPIDEYPIDAWMDLVATNLTGAFLCARRAFSVMKAQDPTGGRIVNNGSLSAYVPRPHSVAYTAAKHAVTGLTKALALEGRARNIACGQIDVGNAATEITAAMERGVLQADGSTAAEPTIDVEHVARAVLYMAGLPLDANVQHMTVMATGMPFAGRG